MKRDEPFAPQAKAGELPPGILFRKAGIHDHDAIVALTAQRNPHQELTKIEAMTARELKNVAEDGNYQHFVAELENQVVGFCRAYHSAPLPAEKRRYPAPEGWYGMGILVSPDLRRRGIARFLSEHRLAALRAQGVRELYSIVDARNLTSVHMHLQFGFEKIAEAEGFLHLRLESGLGYLFRKSV